MDFNKQQHLAEIQLERDLRELVIKNRKSKLERRTKITESNKPKDIQRIA